MSLLMDALKKAEQEKKAAAKRLSETEQNPSDNQEDFLLLEQETDIVSPEITGEHKKPLTDLGSSGSFSKDSFTSTAELSLAPLEPAEIVKRGGDVTGKTRLEERPSVASEDMTLNVAVDELSIDPFVEAAGAGHADMRDAAAGDALRIGAGTAMDETFHGVSFDAEKENSELFQETIQGEPYQPMEGEGSYEETLPGVPAAQLARDIGGGEGQPTPVAAQTVFTATNSAAKGSSFGFKFGLIGSAVVVLIGVGVWYYYTVTPMNPELPSPLVARGIETVVPVQIPPQQAPEPMAATLINQTPDEPAHTEQQQADATGSTEPVTDTVAQTDTAPAQTGKPGAEENAGNQPDTTDKAAPLSAQTAPAAQEAPIELRPALMKISRSKVSDEKGKLVNEAYAAYQAGDYEMARQKYTQVLDSYPDNRDSLLGLAAIAMKNNDLNQAVVIYSRLLRINPQDHIVKALLINLQKGTDALSNESSIKSMLQSDREQPVLYFALGHIYAREARWPEAQQAFFDAYRLDSSNPDYALNLAVSLDHVNQYDAALDYYEVALKLAGQKPLSVDPSVVLTRIQILSGVVKP